MVKQVSDKAQFEELIKGDKAVIVDFFATWCPPCKAIAPLFVQLSEDASYPNLEFVKVDVDEGGPIAQMAGVSAMPTFQVYKGGQKIDEMVGASADKLKEMCDKHGK
mmetsp:Transcript_24877/g.71362  ORF Transcript_24877/g.71362 Transcript_24877/m.71362 type:complete len:107 (-) Transcript_24877:93-413(-)